MPPATIQRPHALLLATFTLLHHDYDAAHSLNVYICACKADRYAGLRAEETVYTNGHTMSACVHLNAPDAIAGAKAGTASAGAASNTAGAACGSVPDSKRSAGSAGATTGGAGALGGGGTGGGSKPGA